MSIKKEELRNLLITNLVFGGFVMLIAKVLFPQFIYLDGLLSAIGDRNIIAILYLCGIIFFALLSYISFLCGLFIVYDETIGKIIRAVKTLFGYHEFRRDYYYDSECYTSRDVLMIAAYTFVAVNDVPYLASTNSCFNSNIHFILHPYRRKLMCEYFEYY